MAGNFFNMLHLLVVVFDFCIAFCSFVDFCLEPCVAVEYALSYPLEKSVPGAVAPLHPGADTLEMILGDAVLLLDAGMHFLLDSYFTVLFICRHFLFKQHSHLQCSIRVQMTKHTFIKYTLIFQLLTLAKQF